MPYDPATDKVGLWRSVSGGVEKAEMPGVDFMVSAMTRAGLLRTVTSQTAPTTNQATTAWFQPANPSYASEGTLFLWDPTLNIYVPATPELFHGGSSGGGGGGGDGGGGMSDAVIISGTAPTSPTPGMEWWNGTILQLWDGGMWKTVGPPLTPSGTPLQTTTPVFAVSCPLPAVTVPTSTWGIIPIVATPSIDTMSGWDGVTHKYTPKKSGIYQFGVNGVPQGTGTVGIMLMKNDPGSYTGSEIVLACNTAQISVGITSGALAQMNGTTDYVRMFGIAQGGLFSGLGSNPVLTAAQLP